MRSWIVVAAVIAACRTGTSAVPPSNRAAGGGVVVAATDALGWIAVAPAADAKMDWEMDWPPRDASAMAWVPAPAEGLAAGAAITVVGSSGAAVSARVGETRSIPYGCDGGQLDMIAIEGDARLPAGVAWVVPPSAPVTWRPEAVAIAAGKATATQRGWTVGELAIALVRTDDTHARLTVRDGERVVGDAAFEKTYMQGADRAPIALTEQQPGVPELAAAFAIAPGGPWLLVLLVPGYEGVSLAGYLVDRDRFEVVPALGTYLYQCAF